VPQSIAKVEQETYYKIYHAITEEDAAYVAVRVGANCAGAIQRIPPCGDKDNHLE
jgi:hypothetical protein